MDYRNKFLDMAINGMIDPIEALAYATAYVPEDKMQTLTIVCEQTTEQERALLLEELCASQIPHDGFCNQ